LVQKAMGGHQPILLLYLPYGHPFIATSWYYANGFCGCADVKYRCSQMLDGLVSSHPKIRHNDTQYNDILYDDDQHDILHLITLSKKGLFVTLSLKCLFATLVVSVSSKKNFV